MTLCARVITGRARRSVRVSCITVRDGWRRRYDAFRYYRDGVEARCDIRVIVGGGISGDIRVVFRVILGWYFG